MPDERAGTLHFHPERAREQIPQLLPSCTAIREQEGGHRLVVVFEQSTPLSERELGRLLVIHGKCANSGLRITLRCSAVVVEQLSRLLIDRLIILERING
ncbi:MAG: hypothetical protein ACE15F_15120 [bacterium]